MNDEREFRQQFDPLFRELNRHAGDCPDPDALGAYLSRACSAAEQARIREHVEVCGACDALLERMAAFDAEPAEAPPKRRPLAWLAHPALAYSLVALLLFPAWLGLRRAGNPPPAAPAVRPAVVLDLNAVRDAGIARAPADARSIVLSFVVPAAPGLAYTATVIGAQGGKEAEAPVTGCDAFGNCHLLLDRTALGPGELRLVVTESDPRTGRERRRFEFPFEL
jgi:hypothetical protein